MGNIYKRIMTNLLISVVCITAFGQITIHLSDFNTSQGAAFVAAGPIGNTSWEVFSPGINWGARIHNGFLELTNTADAGDRADGWVFAGIGAVALGESFDAALDDHQQVISWYFNMRQIRTNPAGFSSGLYGAAFILAATQSNLATQGQGYAVVLGNTGTPDPLRLVKFTEGIQSIGSAAGGIIIASEPLNNPTNSHMSIKVTFNPSTSLWELWGRNDGSSFADPLSGDLSLLGSANDSQFTDRAIGFMGAYWQGATAANQTALFDNVSLWLEGGGSPVISKVIRDPAMDIDSQTAVAVSAQVLPYQSPVATVALQWGLWADQLLETIPMIVVEPGSYRTASPIPAHPDKTEVFYRVMALDEEGNQSFSQVYSYQVIDPVADLIIVGVASPERIEVDKGTLFDDLNLPDSVSVMLNDDSNVMLGVTWQPDGYNSDEPGEYTIQGLLHLADGIVNPDDIAVSVMVEVLPGEMFYSVTFRVIMTHADDFDEQRDQVFLSGSMFDFAIPGTMPELQKLEKLGEGYFGKTMELLQGIYLYRYYINGGFENQEPLPYRELNLVSDTIVTDVWGAMDVVLTSESVNPLRIFPNPTRGILHFSSTMPVRQIDVFSLCSRLEHSVTPWSEIGFIDVTDLLPGVYVLRFQTDHQIRYFRFAKIGI